MAALASLGFLIGHVAFRGLGYRFWLGAWLLTGLGMSAVGVAKWVAPEPRRIA